MPTHQDAAQPNAGFRPAVLRLASRRIHLGVGRLDRGLKMTPEDQLADKHRAELAALPKQDAREIERAMMRVGPVVMLLAHRNAETLLRMLTELEATVSR